MTKRSVYGGKSNKQSAECLAELANDFFSQEISSGVLVNHATYIRDSTSKTLAHFSALLDRKSLLLFWLRSAIMGLAVVFRDNLSSFRQTKTELLGDTSYCEVMFVSHLTNENQLCREADPYFSDLATYYRSQGGAVTTLWLNQVRANIAEHHLQPGHLFESGKFGLWQGCLVWLANARQSIGLALRSLRQPDQASKRYLRFLACTQLDHRTMASARIVDRISEAVSKIRPQIVIITFEGYSWERAVTRKLHQLNPNIQVLGYQHAVLSGGPRAINKKFPDGLNPDHILSAGSVMTTRLVEEGEYTESDFTLIGSPKAELVTASPMGNAVLCVPEGTVMETVMLAECLCRIAREMPNVECILRMHPALKWHLVEPHIRGWNSLLGNLRLSNQSLVEDINQAGWVLYRGSSVAINALLAGRRPIFFDGDNTAMSGDIVPDEIKWRKICRDSDKVMAVVEVDQRDGCQSEEGFREAAQEFAKRYYMPLNHQRFKRVIKRYLN